jgi:glycosyltransferase involved in cell wall biosynthesis
MLKSNLLVLTTSYPFDNGIIEGSFVAEQCECLAKNGIDVTVVCPHYHRQKTMNFQNGVKVNRFRYFFPTKYEKLAYGAGIPTNLQKSFLAIIQLPIFTISFFIKAYKLSRNQLIIYSHWTIPTLIAILVKKINKKIKVIFMNHGVEIFVLGQTKIGIKFLKFIIKNSDIVISNSSYTYTKTQQIKFHKKHFIIQPGVDVNKFKPNEDNIRSRYNIANDKFLLFSLGYFIERKGFEYLIKAMNIIVNHYKNNEVILIIGGRGPLRRHYEQMIRENKLNDNIFLAGYIPQEEILSYYNSCDVFVLPAIVANNNDTEGLGVVLNEANACGKPVIATRVGGITDVIKDYENGILIEEKNEIELADVILKLRNNPTLMNQMGKKGRELAIKEFSWEMNVKKTIELIISI